MKLSFSIYVILVILIPVVHLWKPKSGSKLLPVCKSRQCRDRGRWYYQSLNPKADPCIDFYEYACGSWNTVHPGPNYAIEWNIQDLLSEAAFAKTRKLLEVPIHQNDIYHIRKAKIAYQFCMDKPYMAKRPLSGLQRLAKEISSANIKSPWVAHDQYLQLTGASAFFEYTTWINEKDDYKPIIRLKSQSSPYGLLTHLPEWAPDDSAAYEEFYVDIYKALAALRKESFNEKAAKENAKRLHNFREKMSETIQKTADLPNDKFTPMKVKDLQSVYDKLLRHTMRTKIDWRNIVSILYKNTTTEMLDTEDLIVLRRKTYFRNLALLLDKTPTDVISKHIEMFFIETQLLLSDKAVQKLIRRLKNSETFKSFLKDDIPRWLMCTVTHQLRHSLGIMYINSYFNKKDGQPIRGLITRMKFLMLTQAKESTWMDINMKLNVAAQVSKLQIEIGYPDWYVHPNGNSDPEDPAPTRADATFYVKENKIYISAAMLKPPMYDPAVPPVINVGSIGNTISHELYHMFADCGRIPSSGEIMDWWTADAVQECDKRKQCFLDAYQNYAVEELKGVVDEKEIDSHRTFVEDVADVMGLKVSHFYLTESLRLSNTKCEVLPHFERFTCDQMFFIAYANAMCGRDNLLLLKKNFHKKQHNLRKIRVNGAMKQHDAFGEAFGCPVGSPMNPAKKCDIWK